MRDGSMGTRRNRYIRAAIIAGIMIAMPTGFATGQTPERQGRLRPLNTETLSPAQKAANDAFAKTIGSPTADGPFGVLMYTPPSMDGALKLWDAYRNHRVNEDRHYALVIL